MKTNSGTPSFRTALGIVVGVALMGSGCVPELQLKDVESLSISCDSIDECPQSMTCSPQGLCVPSDREDFSAPAVVGDIVLRPEIVQPGDSVELQFTVSEALGQDPELVASGVLEGLSFTQSAQSDLTYTYAATVPDNSAEGLATFRCSLQDRFGNAAAGILLGDIEVDATAPTLLSVQYSLNELRLGNTLFVTLTASELLNAPPSILGTLGEKFTYAEGTSYVFSLAIDASIPEGENLLRVSLQDIAGNVSPDLDGGAFLVDNSLPEITNLSVVPQVLGPGDAFSLSFDISEDVEATGGSLEVNFASRALSCIGDGNSYQCDESLLVDEITAGTEERLLVTVLARDGAGNTASKSESLVIDFRPPSITVGDVALLAPSNSPLFDVDALAEGGRAIISILVNEVSAQGTPTLHLQQGAQSLSSSFLDTQSSATNLRFEVTIDDCLAVNDGPYAAYLELEDLAGNQGELLEDDLLSVDCTDPDFDTLSSTAIFRHLRMPYGARANNYSSQSYVVAQDFPPGDDPLIAPPLPQSLVDSSLAEVKILQFFSSDVGGFVLGQSSLEGESFPVPLLLSDSPSIYVGLVDKAGNISERRQITQGRWMGRVLDSNAQVHRAELRPVDRGGVLQARSDSRSSASELEAQGDAVVSAAGALTVFAPSTQSFIDDGLAVAFDPYRGRALFLTEGTSCGSPDVCLYAHDDTGFNLISVSDPEGDGNPPGNSLGLSWVYDIARNVAVFIPNSSGTDSVTGCGGVGCVWEFDGLSWSAKTPLDSGDGQPSPRSNAATVYDPVQGRILMFGGRKTGGSACANADGNLCGDLWSYDGESWAEIQSGGAQPRHREYGAAAFDIADNAMILFGGTTSTTGAWESECDGEYYASNARCGDTWKYKNGAWSKINGSDLPHPYTGRPALLYRPDQQDVVLSGATHACNTGIYQCRIEPHEWILDEDQWTPLIQADPEMDGEFNPNELSYYDSSERRIRAWRYAYNSSNSYCPNGSTGQDFLELWERRESSWAKLHTIFDGPSCDTPPASRSGTSFSHFPSRNLHFLFGGTASFGIDCDGAGGTCCNETWAHDGFRWTQVSTSATPLGRAGTAADYFEEMGRTLLFGGRVQSAPGGACNVYSSETYTFDGSTFELLSPATSPSSRAYGSLSYDPLRKVAVLFGGRFGGTPRTDVLWEFDGLSWDRRCDGSPVGDTCASLPAARHAHSAVYHPSMQQVVIFGGQASFSGPGLNDTWAWDGSVWSQLDDGSSGIPGKTAATLAWNESRQTMQMFNGVVPGSEVERAQEIWEYRETTGWAEVFRFSPYEDIANLESLDRPAYYDADLQSIVYFDGTFEEGRVVGRKGQGAAMHWSFDLADIASDPSTLQVEGLAVDVFAGASSDGFSERVSVRLHHLIFGTLSNLSYDLASTPELGALVGEDYQGPWRVQLSGNTTINRWCVGEEGAASPDCREYPALSSGGSPAYAPLFVPGSQSISTPQIDIELPNANGQVVELDVVSPPRADGPHPGVFVDLYGPGGWEEQATAPSAIPTAIEELNIALNASNDPAQFVVDQKINLRVRPSKDGNTPSSGIEVDYLEIAVDYILLDP